MCRLFVVSKNVEMRSRAAAARWFGEVAEESSSALAIMLWRSRVSSDWWERGRNESGMCLSRSRGVGVNALPAIATGVKEAGTEVRVGVTLVNEKTGENAFPDVINSRGMKSEEGDGMVEK